MARWKRNSWLKKWRDISNRDLWQVADTLLAERLPETVRVVKVKGHAKWEDVERGTATIEDKLGNDKADELAVMGAALHSIPQCDRHSFRRRAHLALDLQKMMLEILIERDKRRRRFENDDDDELLITDDSDCNTSSGSASSDTTQSI